ncbi:hypothetical protein K505DRAFT_99070 [Melanomma pulvis-pyrius CBS 109.77]|uniref:Uncharacterized protein n=1 Tax=Melanomma pulvis-pyrius CBS 109.77 TaxID=1314802 RepID=A0A6A6WYT2_9PLEO|nr:hypothetical protein K505DRAFT_99070 [Melanomma pulvis-pyrius CBS 109.77]
MPNLKHPKSYKHTPIPTTTIKPTTPTTSITNTSPSLPNLPRTPNSPRTPNLPRIPNLPRTPKPPHRPPLPNPNPHIQQPQSPQHPRHLGQAPILKHGPDERLHSPRYHLHGNALRARIQQHAPIDAALHAALVERRVGQQRLLDRVPRGAFWGALVGVRCRYRQKTEKRRNR